MHQKSIATQIHNVIFMCVYMCVCVKFCLSILFYSSFFPAIRNFIYNINFILVSISNG